MTKITYEIVEHDGGWAYRVDGVFSETFSSHDMARRAAERAAKEQVVPGDTTGIWTRMVVGTTKCRPAMIDPRPTSRSEGSLRRRSAPAPTPSFAVHVSYGSSREILSASECYPRNDPLATIA